MRGLSLRDPVSSGTLQPPLVPRSAGEGTSPANATGSSFMVTFRKGS